MEILAFIILIIVIAILWNESHSRHMTISELNRIVDKQNRTISELEKEIKQLKGINED